MQEPEYRKELLSLSLYSMRCAEAVPAFLATNGISADRIIALRGYGESYLVTTNTTEAGRQQKRPVEGVSVQEGQQVVER